jgi:hypothetical protein
MLKRALVDGRTRGGVGSMAQLLLVIASRAIRKARDEKRNGEKEK